MSQAKVDKRKYEKKNRKQLEKKRKARFAGKCILAALIIGTIIGVPVGINIYRGIPKFVGDSSLKAYVSDYIDSNHSSEVDTVKAIEAKSSEEKADTTEAETTEGSADTTEAETSEESAATTQTENSEEASDTTETTEASSEN